MSENLWAVVKFNLGGLFCYSCQSIVIAVFEKAGWYKMDTIKRHVVSKRHKKATASYTVKITGPDFTIKTERNAKSSWNKWNISSKKFENSLRILIWVLTIFVCFSVESIGSGVGKAQPYSPFILKFSISEVIDFKI